MLLHTTDNGTSVFNSNRMTAFASTLLWLLVLLSDWAVLHSFVLNAEAWEFYR